MITIATDDDVFVLLLLFCNQESNSNGNTLLVYAHIKKCVHLCVFMYTFVYVSANKYNIILECVILDSPTFFVVVVVVIYSAKSYFAFLITLRSF